MRLMLVVAAVAMTTAACGSSSSPSVVHRSTPAVGNVASPSSISTPRLTPMRLTISRIGVDAEVESVGLDATGHMVAPSKASTVAWYSSGAAPGQAGHVVIAGHLDWPCLGCPAVFWHLGDLRSGDLITVIGEEGQHSTYAVIAGECSELATVTPAGCSWAADAAPADVFATTGSPALELITCGGQWNAARRQYERRLIVTAKPI